MTDNGKVFTGKHFRPPVKVFFEKICRENGIETILAAPYSQTKTGEIERFHRTLPAEFLTGRVFDSLHQAQAELNAWVTRNLFSAGVVTVSWQQILVGKHRGGRKVDIHVTSELLKIWDGSELLKTVLNADQDKEVMVKKAFTMPQKKSESWRSWCKTSTAIEQVTKGV